MWNGSEIRRERIKSSSGRQFAYAHGTGHSLLAAGAHPLAKRTCFEIRLPFLASLPALGTLILDVHAAVVLTSCGTPAAEKASLPVFKSDPREEEAPSTGKHAHPWLQRSVPSMVTSKLSILTCKKKQHKPRKAPRILIKSHYLKFLSTLGHTCPRKNDLTAPITTLTKHLCVVRQVDGVL